jgi:hypothetical protein
MAHVKSLSFESGTTGGLVPGTDISATNVTVSTAAAKTGTYGLLFNVTNGFFQLAVPAATEYYASAYIRRTGAPQTATMWYGIRTDNAKHVIVEHQLSDGLCRAYRDGTLVATGTQPASVNDWFRLEFRILLHGSTGSIQTKVDGKVDIDFTGNTLPAGAATINYIRMQEVTNVQFHTDNWWIDDASWPGAKQAVAILPTADTAQLDWVRTGGTATFDVLDDRPANDAQFISSTADGQISRVELADTYDDTDKQIVGVQMIARVKATDGTEQLIFQSSDGANHVDSANIALQTSFAQVTAFYINAPDAGAWSKAKVDALKLGLKSAIV